MPKKSKTTSFVILKDDVIIHIIDIFKKSVETLTILFNTDSIKINTLDITHCFLITLDLQNPYEESTLTNPEKVKITTESFLLALRSVYSNELSLKMEFKSDCINVISFDPEDEDGDFNKCKVPMLYDSEDEEMEFDNEFTSHIIFDASFFSTNVKKLSKFDEKILISAKQNTDFVIMETVNETNKMTTKVKKNKEKLKKLIIHEEDEEIKVRLDSKHLSEFIRCDKFSNKVLLDIKETGGAVGITYLFNKYEYENSYIRFIVASYDMEE